MRSELFVLWLLFGAIPSATAQVSVEVNLPGASIGINQPVYPELVAVPGYPVYYAPQINSNYFFYDGMYWVYQRDNWYASSWYNGPWGLVGPEAVPLFILRIPVRYYREPPAYFHGWSSDAAPRWGEHWGDAWDQRRHGWDTWDRAAVPAPAPLPAYQRQYTGNSYPAVAQQQQLQTQNYRYRPHDVVVHQAAQAPTAQPAPAAVPPARQAMPQAKNSPQQAQHGSAQQSAAASRQGAPPQQAVGDVQRSAAARVSPQQGSPTTQPAKQPPKQAVAQGKPQASSAQTQPKGPGPQAKIAHVAQPPQQAVAQHPTQRPTPAVAQHQEQAPRTQPPQSKAPAQEPKQGQENGHEKG